MLKQANEVVFIYYEIKAIKPRFRDSLYKFLLDNVWGDRGFVDEDIRVTNVYEGRNDNEPIDTIRYQFGDIENANYFKNEVAELIESKLNEWVYLNSKTGNVVHA